MKKAKARFNWTGLCFVVGAIAVWQLLASTGPFGSLESLPTPVEVLEGLSELYNSGTLMPDVIYTLYVIAISSAIAITAGLALGLLLGLSSWFDAFFSSSLDVLRTIPVVALMPVALLLWGAEPRTEIIVASVAATWPMMINTAGGIRTVHPRLREVAKMFHFSPWRTLTRVLVPATMAELLVGARLSIVTALVATIVAEMVISPYGLGWALVRAQNALRPGQLWAVVLLCGLLGYLLNTVLGQVVRRVHGTQGTGARA